MSAVGAKNVPALSRGLLAQDNTDASTAWADIMGEIAAASEKQSNRIDQSPKQAAAAASSLEEIRHKQRENNRPLIPLARCPNLIAGLNDERPHPAVSGIPIVSRMPGHLAIERCDCQRYIA